MCHGEQGVDYIIFVAALDRKLLLRPYAIHFKKSGTKVITPLFPVNHGSFMHAAAARACVHCTVTRSCLGLCWERGRFSGGVGLIGRICQCKGPKAPLGPVLCRALLRAGVWVVF